jgi:hypothetical protein
MKRIFPVITILILLSLLGIIFFQFLWIKGSLESEEQKFYEHVSLCNRPGCKRSDGRKRQPDADG